jgi:hypothetical protein
MHSVGRGFAAAFILALSLAAPYNIREIDALSAFDRTSVRSTTDTLAPSRRLSDQRYRIKMVSTFRTIGNGSAVSESAGMKFVALR